MGLHPRQPSVAAAGTADVATGATSTGLGYDAHDLRWDRRWMVLVLAVSGLAVAVGVAFVWLQVAGPSDGARMQPGSRTWAHGGVVVSPLATRPGGLASGDVVVAVDGRPMRAWEQGLVAPHAPHPRWQVGQTVTYTVQRHGRRLDVPVRLRSYPWRGLVQQDWSMLLYLLLFALVGTYVFIRRPADRAAKVLFVSTSTLLAANVVWSFGLQVTDITGRVGFWLSTTMALVVNPICWAGFLHFVLLFPRVHPVLAGRGWIIPSLYLVAFPCSLASVAVFRAMTPGTLDWLEPWGLGSNTVILGYMALIVLVLWSNLRAPLGAVAHQQLRWIVFAGLLAGGGDLLLWILPASALGHPVISLNALGLVLLPIPLALAVAILRYHVFDIDVLITRTVVYGLLTALATTVYLAVVVGIGTLVGSRGKPNLFLTIVATAVIAVAFLPARDRSRRLANRLVYGKRATPYEVLSGFSRGMAGASTEDSLLRMARLVVEATGAVQATVWLRLGEVLQPQAAWPQTGPPPRPIALEGRGVNEALVVLEARGRAFPVAYEDELLGALTVTVSPAEPLTPAGEKLIADLAAQTGLGLRFQRMKERALFARALASFLPPEVAELVEASPSALSLREELEATILFSDIRGFSSLAERLPPRQVAEVVGRHLTAMVEVVTSHGGVLDKFAGDAVMAVFGAPRPAADHARRALECAVAMQHRQVALNVEAEQAGLPAFQIGIGVNTGTVIAGTLGGPGRLDYTVLGDAVNIAQRLQSEAVGGEILASAVTVQQSGTDRAEPAGFKHLKGREHPVEVYRIRWVDTSTAQRWGETAHAE